MNRTASDVILAPSLLSVDWTRAGEQVSELERLGVEWLHFDAMDGHFVPNLSFGALFLKAMRRACNLHFDAHLMVANVADRLEEFLEAGAQSISVHAENQPHLHRLVHTVKDGGAMAGVVLNPATPLEVLDWILPDLDYVLIMSVNPGFGGQKFLPFSLSKIEQLARKRSETGLNFKIQVDGGVSPSNVGELVRAGVDIVVAGSAVFAPPKPLSETVGAMRAGIESAFQIQV
ncbi:ribulose-phosphate 3-epimerase [Abditibacteriota bacterium]|nr:ribulose-phosphate 3-epimerase [Abditibacteriota bacterium]